MGKTNQSEQLSAPPSSNRDHDQDNQAGPVVENTKPTPTSAYNMTKFLQGAGGVLCTVLPTSSRPAGNPKVNFKGPRKSPVEGGGVSIIEPTGDDLPLANPEVMRDSPEVIQDSLEVMQDSPEVMQDSPEQPKNASRSRPNHGNRSHRGSGKLRHGNNSHAHPAEEHRRIKDLEQNHRETIRTLRGQLQVAEAQNDDYRTQFANMSQIIQLRGRQGLPYPPEDGFFSRELENLWIDVGQFARSASRDQQEPIGPNLPEILGAETYGIVNSAFTNLPELLSHNPARTLRTRCIEVIIIKELEDMIFGRSVCGVSSKAEGCVDKLWNIMFEGRTISDRDLHLWQALSIHLLTNDNPSFEAKLELKIPKLTETLASKLTPLGAFGKGSFNELTNIVTRAAKIKQQIAILPFIIQRIDLVPGIPFDSRTMEEVGMDDDMGPEDLQIHEVPVDVVFSQPVVKFEWDAEGRKLDEINNPSMMVVLCKGRVLCKSMS